MSRVKGGGILLASAARTTAQVSDDLNSFDDGVIVVLNVSVKSGAGSLTPSIQGKDPASGNYYDILTATAVTATGTYTYYVGPSTGTNAALTKTVAVGLPSPWRVSVAVGNADSWTYSVGYQTTEP